MLKIGDSIGKYKVTKEINVGGFCNSYFVSDSSGIYFLKEYTEPKETDPVFKPFYDNQCVIIERLDSMASITEKYASYFMQEGIYYQVKIKLKGIDLETYFKSSPEFEQRKDLGIILCGILRSLHSKGIVHQDLKPAQLMLVDDEMGKKTKLGYRIVLSDFDWSIPDGKVVQIVGTPYYKSPEHYRNQTPIFASDIFTLGIMLYELLTGRNPFDFDDTPEDEVIKDRVLKGKIFSSPKQANSEINDQINAIIIRCLNPDPTKRPDLSEIQSTLLDTSTVVPSIPSPSPISEPTSISASVPKTTSSSKFTIMAAGQKMIVYGDREVGRRDLKLFFPECFDMSGNSLHKYCDENLNMFTINRKSDGSFKISAPNETKNYFKLNGDKIGKEEKRISIGDKLELYSTSSNAVVGIFDIKD